LLVANLDRVRGQWNNNGRQQFAMNANWLGYIFSSNNGEACKKEKPDVG